MNHATRFPFFLLQSRSQWSPWVGTQPHQHATLDGRNSEMTSDFPSRCCLHDLFACVLGFLLSGANFHFRHTRHGLWACSIPRNGVRFLYFYDFFLHQLHCFLTWAGLPRIFDENRHGTLALVWWETTREQFTQTRHPLSLATFHIHRRSQTSATAAADPAAQPPVWNSEGKALALFKPHKQAWIFTFSRLVTC